MWRNRKQLPSLQKLNIKFDIDKLKSAIQELKSREWSAYQTDFSDLRKGYANIEKNSDWLNDNTAQFACTTFNHSYEIRPNRNSGSKWDNTFMKGDKKYDERAYNIIKPDLPEYLNTVFDFFQPEISRTIISKISPGYTLPKHMDHDSTLSVRYHIAIETNENCIIGYEEEGIEKRVHIPADGYLWFLNPGKPHWVENNSDSSRIHLIINMDSQRLINDSKNIY